MDPETQGEESIEDIAGDMEETEQVETGAGDEHEDDDAPDNDDADDQPDQGEDDPEEEWEAGGKQFRVKRSELRAGYMKDADYRQKTAELAEQRRAVEAVQQHIQQERQGAANQLDVYLQALHRELIGTQPDASLIESDPQEYLRQQQAHNARAAAFQTALQQRQALTGRMTADEQRQQAEYRKGEATRLLEVLPQWRDDKVRSKESGEIAAFLQKTGYTPEEMNGLVDHRALLIARDAMRFHQLQAAKAKKQTQEPPRNTLRAGASTDRGTNAARVNAANDRLRRNPDSLDALAGFAHARGV